MAEPCAVCTCNVSTHAKGCYKPMLTRMGMARRGGGERAGACVRVTVLWSKGGQTRIACMQAYIYAP